MSDDRCGNCERWTRDPGESGDGLCGFRPPGPLPFSLTSRQGDAFTDPFGCNELDGCGCPCHKRREDKK